MLVVETIQGVGLENPSDAQNNGTNLVLNRGIHFFGLLYHHHGDGITLS